MNGAASSSVPDFNNYWLCEKCGTKKVAGLAHSCPTTVSFNPHDPFNQQLAAEKAALTASASNAAECSRECRASTQGACEWPRCSCPAVAR